MYNDADKLAIFAIILFIIGQVAFAYWAKDSFKGTIIKYDCSISEISPDFPPQVKEACRKLRAQNGRI